MPAGLSRRVSPAAHPPDPELRGRNRRSPWVWWHLLSLDAPTVAVVWCWFFGAVFHLHYSWVVLPTLALGTWCVYVADRLLDGWRSTDMVSLRDRHWFYLRHRSLFISAWLIAAVPLAYLIFFRVATAVRTDDVVLCLVGVAYFLLIHSPLRDRALKRGESQIFPGWLPKEMAVGFLFAIATAVPAWARLTATVGLSQVHVWFAVAVLVFGSICWLNCVAIQTWEDAEAAHEVMHTILSNAQDHEVASRPKGLTGILGSHLREFAWSAVVVAVALTFAAVRTPVSLLFAAAGISAALFVGLIRYSHRLDALPLRIAADAALLTPLLFWLRLR